MSKRTRFFTNIPVVFMAVMAGAILSGGGCNNAWDSGEGIQITLDLGQISGVSRNAHRVTAPFDYYTLSLAGPGESQTYRVEKTSPVITVWVIAGTWTIKVEAYNSAGVAVGTGESVLEVGADKDNQAAIHLKPIWTVTWNPAGGNWSGWDTADGSWSGSSEAVTESCIDGNSITPPAAPPVQDGYTFSGWLSTATTDAERVEFPYTPTADITFYAGWQQGLAEGSPGPAGGTDVGQ